MRGSHDAQVRTVARAIQQYLEEHPNAADTLDGITHWWLARQPDRQAPLIVKQALDHLVARGVVERRTGLGGQDLYFRANGAGGRDES